MGAPLPPLRSTALQEYIRAASRLNLSLQVQCAVERPAKRHQIHRVTGQPPTDLVEWMGFDLRELVFHVVGVHRLDLFSGRCTKNLDNFHQLVDTTLTGEQWLPQHQLRHHTTRRPYVCSGDTSSAPHAILAALTDIRRVIGSSKNELWCAVVPRANITDVWFPRHENLC